MTVRRGFAEGVISLRGVLLGKPRYHPKVGCVMFGRHFANCVRPRSKMGYLGKWLRQRVIERIPMQLDEWLTSLGVFVKQSDWMVCLVACFCCFSE